MLNKLPDDLLYLLCEKYLDTKSLIQCSMVNKKMNYMINDQDILWKYKCIYEYNSYVKNKKGSWKISYIRLYKNCCIHCYKKTTLINYFFKIKVCKKCTLSIPKYKTVTYTYIKDYFGLNDNEVSNFPCLEMRNPYGYSRPNMRIYLKSDITNYLKKRYGYYHFTDFIDNTLLSYNAMESVNMISRFIFLYNILSLQTTNFTLENFIQIVIQQFINDKCYIQYIYGNNVNTNLIKLVQKYNDN